MLAQAIRLHEANRLPEAANLYRELLSNDPQNADAFHLLGVLMNQVGQPATAVALIERAIGIKGNFAPYYNNLGNALRACGQVDSAKTSFRRSIALDRREQSSHINLGLLHEQQMEWQEAEDSYTRAHRLNPSNVQAMLGLGNLALRRKRPASAALWYRKALRLAPASAPAHNGLGNALLAEGAEDEACASYEAAIQCQPGYADALINLANVHLKRQRHAKAIALYEQVTQYHPQQADGFQLLGIACVEAKRFAEAIPALTRAIELDAGHAPSHLFLGFAFARDGEPARSIPHFEAAIRLDPACAEAINCLGAAWDAVGDYPAAAPYFEKAHRLEPDCTDYLVNLGLNLTRKGNAEGVNVLQRAVMQNPEHVEAHLALAESLHLFGDPERGWAEYEWRYRQPEFAAQLRDFPQPRWQGELLEGRTILVHAEQGMGDTLQFARFLSAVEQRGGRVILECQPSLVRLLQHVPGVAQCLPQGMPSLPDFDVHCPLLSLPFLLRLSADEAHLPTDLTQTIVGSEVAAARPLRIGLVWRGNPNHKRDRLRSIPLSEFSGFHDLPGTEFVSLQAGSLSASEEAVLFPMEQPCRHVTDVAETAAIVAGLDLVIAVDTAVAHLAGSLRRPVWMLLPEAPDWRWGLRDETTPWYPEMRLFRKACGEAWSQPVRRMQDALRMVVDARKCHAEAKACL